MGDVQRKGLEAPLLRCFGVVGTAEADTGAGLRPMDIGTVGDVERGSGGDGVSGAGRRLGKVVVSEWGGRSSRNGGIAGVEKELSGEGTQATKVVNRKGDKGDVLCV